MFTITITSTRVVGLVAVVCAVVVVAPQTLAATSTHSKPTRKAVASANEVQGYDLSGFDLSALNNIAGYQRQQKFLQGLVPTTIAAGQHKSVKVAPKTTKAASKSVKAATWALPPCTGAQAEYEYVYSGDPCTSTAAPAVTVPAIVPAPAIESGVAARTAVSRRHLAFCNGNDEYDYVYSGCEG